ncbi:LAMI_0F05798g1_1 [Lachancea mirantina]|uniref:DNA repair protein REV1 n=1 Tax=Lachancea mirantina TaxID=1230905 RepID=A0A1G4JYI5_9SACH|nr:LAMI_0F05798g1_1 [Lachancea mirantina]
MNSQELALLLTDSSLDASRSRNASQASPPLQRGSPLASEHEAAGLEPRGDKRVENSDNDCRYDGRRSDGRRSDNDICSDASSDGISDIIHDNDSEVRGRWGSDTGVGLRGADELPGDLSQGHSRQHLLSSLDDEALIQLVNSYEPRPKPERRLADADEGSPSVSPVDFENVSDVSDNDRAPEDARHEVIDCPQTPPQAPPQAHPDGPLAFGDYETYFKHKHVQQQQQDQRLRQIHGVKPPIFKNCIIYVNGRTNPDRLVLHKNVVLYGGVFNHYLSGKTSVTHIIASNLTSKKRIEFQKYKVVTPDWIVDSIAAGERLPWQRYALITANPNQPTISTTLDCKSPQFLASFFAKSRLHHLSTWKADLRAKFCSKYVGDVSIERLPKTTRLAIFHIDFDCFFATVSALADGRYSLEKQPLAVAHGVASSEIASCNYAARAFGVRNGMWVRSAKRLCPDLVLLPYNFNQYEVKSSILYETLVACGAFNMILPISVDEAICVRFSDEALSDEAIRNDCSKIVSSLRERIFESTQGCSVSIGCGSSLVLARLALKRAKPGGFCIQLSRDSKSVESFVSSFKLNELPGVGYSIVDKIKTNFLRKNVSSPTVADLKQNSTRQALISKLGSKTGAKLALFMEGKDDEESLKILKDPVEFFTRKSMSVDINYAIRFDTIHEIDTFIDRICDHLTQKMKELGLITPQVTLKILRRCAHAPIEPEKYLGSGECDAFSRNSRFGVPTDEMGVIATEVKSSLRMLSCPPKDLRGVAVQFNKLMKASDRDKQRKGLFVGVGNPAKGSLNTLAYHALPKDFRSDIKAELSKRNISVPETPPPKKAVTISPVKDFWARHWKQDPPPKLEFPSSLDNEFMVHLPSQIQRELKQDHAILKKTKRTMRKSVLSKEYKQFEKVINRNFLSEPIKFQALDRPKEILSLVQSWIDDSINSGPHSADLILFDKYLTKLSDAGKTHFILRMMNLMSSRLEYHSSYPNSAAGRQEWEEYMLRRIVPLLNQSCHNRGTALNFTFDV